MVGGQSLFHLKALKLSLQSLRRILFKFAMCVFIQKRRHIEILPRPFNHFFSTLSLHFSGLKQWNINKSSSILQQL